MATTRSFLDNLANLRLVLSVALEHIQANRDQFLKAGTAERHRRANERSTEANQQNPNSYRGTRQRIHCPRNSTEPTAPLNVKNELKMNKARS